MPYQHDGHRAPSAQVTTQPTQRTRRTSVQQRLRAASGLREQEAMLKPRKTGLLFLGMNPDAKAEEQVLRSRSEEGVTAITNSKNPDQVRTGAKVHDLSKREGVEAFVQELALAGDLARRVVDLIGRQAAGAKDEVAQIVRVYAEAERGERALERVVFSGHSVGSVIWGDGNGMIEFSTFIRLAEIFPKAAGQVEDLMLSACYTGGEAQIEPYRRMFPNLKTVWAYAGSSPGTYSGAQTHIKLWEKATEGKDPARVDRDLAKGTRKGENVATWTTTTGYKGTQPVPFGQALAAVRQAEGVFQEYFSGQREVLNPQSGPLREYYNAVQRVLADPRCDSGTRALMERRRDVTIRLLFYGLVRRKFMATHGNEVKAGYDEVRIPVPDYATISRGRALAEISRFSEVAVSHGEKARRAARLLEHGLRDLDPAWIPANWV